MKKLLVFALATIGMVACFSEDVVELPKSDTIRFADAYIDNATRAEQAKDPSTTKATLEAFDVWAYMTSLTGTVLVDEDVERVGGDWDYANLQYWTPEKNYFFAALAPMNSDNWDLDASQAVFGQGAGLVEFTNVDGSEDLLYATANVTTPDMSTLQNEGMTTVKFQFQHLLSKVKFTFKNGFLTDNATIKVENIKMSAPESGSINLAAGYDWVLDNASKVYEFGHAGTISKLATAQCDRERLTIPAAADYTYNIDFDITLYYGAEEAYTVHKKSVVTGVAIEMGKAYNFVAEITPDNLNLLPIVFEVVGVEAWEDAAEDVEVDYYYDNASKTYSVATAEGLQEVVAKINAGELDANVALLGNIDLAELSRSRAGENNWTPLGLSTKNYYRGTFNGNGYTIKNMVCNGTDVAGLVGYTYSGSVKNVTLENATITSNHFAAGIVAWVNNLPGNTKVPFVLENCHVLNSTISSTPELVNGAYDNGDKVGGLIGAAWFTSTGVRNEGTKVANCSVKNTTIKAYRDLGGLFGLAQGVYAENCVVENVTVEQDLTNGYKDEVPTTVGQVIGRDSGYNVVNGCEYISTAADLAAALTSDKENIAVALVNDIEVPITSLGVQTGGSGEYKLGGANTKNITIDLGGHKLTIATTYWSVLGAKNNDALFTIKNGTMTSSQTSGTWNSYDLCFANCNYDFENVAFEKAIALEGKSYNLKNISIAETHDYYAIWVPAKGQNITIDGLNIESAGRCVKIDEQYVGAADKAQVTMNVSNATFKSVKKAAIVVKSTEGAVINWGAGNNIDEVAADNTFGVWVDEAAAAYADKVIVNGVPSKVEGAASVLVYTVDDLNKLSAKNTYVVLKADLDFQGAAMAKPIELWGDSTFDGNGHKISNVTTAVQGGYATSLFRGDANPGNKVVKNLVVENLSTPEGYSFAAAIWSDLQGANIVIDNVTINNSTIAAAGTVGGFVGFVSASTTNVTIKNSSINNTNLVGGEADHKRGAVVGRAYGCKVSCENVVVENVKINDVAATESTLVGDKGYTGSVTVK